MFVKRVPATVHCFAMPSQYYKPITNHAWLGLILLTVITCALPHETEIKLILQTKYQEYRPGTYHPLVVNMKGAEASQPMVVGGYLNMVVGGYLMCSY